MKQMKKQLRQVSSMRTIGFASAVEDLGTHMMCGNEVPYTVCQVRKVLKGEHKSERLLKTIAEKRPDLFGLWFVCDSVKEWYADHVEDDDGDTLDAEEAEIRYRELCSDIEREERD